jgi:hypothetical protein
MQATSSPSSTTEITWQDKRYAARVIAGGAAFELYSDTHEQGFEPAGRAFHRYVHASEVASDGGELLRAGDSPIALPVMPGADVRTVQRLSQDPRIGVADRALVAALGLLGYGNEAKEAVADFLSVVPGMTIAYALRETRFAASDRVLLEEGWRRAGLPGG